MRGQINDSYLRVHALLHAFPVSESFAETSKVAHLNAGFPPMWTAYILQLSMNRQKGLESWVGKLRM